MFQPIVFQETKQAEMNHLSFRELHRSKDVEHWSEKVIIHMESNFHDPDYSVGQLSSAIGMSERNFQRRFKEAFQLTFKEILIDIRLKNSTVMLCQGDKVSDVAVACGFNEPSYFAKIFKIHRGVTPSEYRHRCQYEGKCKSK